MWYYCVIGDSKCLIVDIWWQIEIGGFMIIFLFGVIFIKFGLVILFFFGIIVDIVNQDGEIVDGNNGGYLVVKYFWFGMMWIVYGDEDCFCCIYWEYLWLKNGEYIYFVGDGVYKDEDGYFWVMGCVDDVINVVGYCLGIMEVELVLVFYFVVVEVVVVGKFDEVKGEDIVVFVILEGVWEVDENLEKELKQYVVKEIGAIVCFGEIWFIDDLLKICFGKIM